MSGDEPHFSVPFWPILLLVLAFNFFLGVEIHSVMRVTDRINQQHAAVSARAKLMESQMAASKTWQTMLEGMANDLLDMAKNDPDTRKLVEKYQIRKNQPVAPVDPKGDKDKTD